MPRRIKTVLANAKKMARDYGWIVRLHKPLTKRPYYSIRKPGNPLIYRTNRLWGLKIHEALECDVLDAIKREAAEAAWQAKQPLIRKIQSAMYMDPSDLDTPDTRLRLAHHS